MRLNSIKLSGFKSFAEPTNFLLPGQLVGVVGPNGCGKSNIMDAVRWVLGESRASELRGESMQDVIFNGTTTRKQASRSSVELVFDNADHRAGGQWAQFAEISVKRVLTRDGTSSYYINEAFVDMVQASVAPVRRPLPFTKMKKGVDGRAFLVDYFTKETLRRRAEGGGQDMFSQFATATREDGSLLPVDEVVDHMNFLMMAAHDTITSSATSLIYHLATNPEWQEKLREEIFAVTGGPDGDGNPRALDYDDLGKLELTEMAFKESLRMIPPVPSMPRRALREFEYGGYRIPAGAMVGINIHWTHHSEEYWENPHAFDPMRFTPDKVKARHKYAWVPFGGGAHMCLGLHFAYMQVKVLMAQLLQRYRIEAAEGYNPQWQDWPIPQPKDGLRVTFQPL